MPPLVRDGLNTQPGHGGGDTASRRPPNVIILEDQVSVPLHVLPLQMQECKRSQAQCLAFCSGPDFTTMVNTRTK